MDVPIRARNKPVKDEDRYTKYVCFRYLQCLLRSLLGHTRNHPGYESDIRLNYFPFWVFPYRSKSTIIPLQHWEVLPDQIIFEEEIGCGAFGKVFKGTFKESPGIEVFYEPITQTVDYKEERAVAIKVLGGK